MQGLGVNDFGYNIGCEQREPGFWVADIDIPALHLQLKEIYIRAASEAEFDVKLDRWVRAFVHNLRHPPKACWN